MMTYLELSYNDISEVVHEAGNKDYMQKYLAFLRLMSKKGWFKEKESNINLEYIAGDVYEQLYMYDLLMKALASPDRNKREPLCSVTSSKYGKINVIKDDFMIYLANEKGDMLARPFCTGLVRDLTIRKLKNRKESGEGVFS